MAAATCTLQNVQPKLRRTRRKHLKVRSGCYTCKIRRKKCDEQRPFCLRCSSTGRKCDGYPPVLKCLTPEVHGVATEDNFEPDDIAPPTKKLRLQRHHNQDWLQHSPSFLRNPPLLAFQSNIEAQCFDYFRRETGPLFTSYYDSSLWGPIMVQAAFQHPAVLQAAAAAGAAHRRFCLGFTKEAFEYCVIADKLQRRALKTLCNVYQSGGTCAREAVALASMLHSMFEGFQANHSESVQHLTRGVKYLLNRPFKVTYSESRYCMAEMKESTFRRFFKSMHYHAVQIFGSKVNTLNSPTEGERPPQVPEQFFSLEQARDFLFTEVEFILYDFQWLWQDVKQRHKSQAEHVSRLLQWSVGYAEMTKRMTERTNTERRACRLLKLTRNTAFLLLSVTLFVSADELSPRSPHSDIDVNNENPENRKPASATGNLWNAIENRELLNTNLARWSVMAESVVNDESVFYYDEHSASFNTGVGPPRLQEPDPDGGSSAKTRHMVKSFLRNSLPGEASQPTDELWQRLGAYGVAERLGAIEEHAVVSVLKDSVLPAGVSPTWCDMAFFLHEKKLLLRYCRPDDYGMGLIWTQEWLDMC